MSQVLLSVLQYFLMLLPRIHPRPTANVCRGTSRTATIAGGSAFIAEALGLEATIVVGYKGSKEIALAAIRGEVDGFIPSDSSAAWPLSKGPMGYT